MSTSFSFLHLLLLSVAYGSHSQSSGQRMCTIWRNGIFWRDDNNTVIELLDNNRRVLVAMSYDETSTVEYAKLRGSLIVLIRRLLHKHCPALKVCEFLISPNHVCRYPFDTFPDTELFDMYHVARSILLRKPVVLSYKDGSGHLKTQSLPFEPYHLLASYVSQLLDPNMANQPVPSPLLQEVRRHCCQIKVKPQEFGELTEYLDQLSLFAGNNPLVSSVAVL